MSGTVKDKGIRGAVGRQGPLPASSWAKDVEGLSSVLLLTCQQPQRPSDLTSMGQS